MQVDTGTAFQSKQTVCRGFVLAHRAGGLVLVESHKTYQNGLCSKRVLYVLIYLFRWFLSLSSKRIKKVIL